MEKKTVKIQNPQLFLKDAQGRKVPVSESIYKAYWHFTNKEDHFMRQLKEESFVYEPERQVAVFVPGKEDSFERLLAEGEEFACDEKSVEEQVIDSLLVRQYLEHMTVDERSIAYLTYALGMTDADAAQQLGIPQSTYRTRRRAMLARIKHLYDDSS